MGKLIGSFCIVLTLFFMAAPQELPAQTFFDQLFSSNKNTGAFHKRKSWVKQRRYYCGDMDAYNKKRAFKRHQPNWFQKMFVQRLVKKTENSPVAQNNPTKKTAPPPSKPTENPPKTENPSKQPPPNKQPEKSVSPPDESPPPVADKSPDKPQKSEVPSLEKKKVPQLTRDALKKMTKDERRDSLLQIEPEIILTPIQFISDQDEFSVVNMDSFIEAMEYAQKGYVVLVEGHTDDLGSAAYNLDLSMKRSEKIRELLLSGGISDELISVIGYGESQPLVPNTSTENRSINRRIEFKIFSLPE